MQQVSAKREFALSGRCRNLSAVAPSLALIVNPEVAGFPAQKLPRRLERDGTHIREEQLFVIAREHFDCLFQREPLHSLDVIHRLAHRTTAGSHMPKLYDLGPPIYRIENGTKKPLVRYIRYDLLTDLSFSA